MKIIGIRALRAKLTECVRLTAAGEESYSIACHGKILARLVGAEHDEAKKSGTGAIHDDNTPGDKEVLMDRPFEVSGAKSLELKSLAKQKLRELEQLDYDDLVQAFMDATAVMPGDLLSDRELRISTARIYQLNLWADQMGAVPRDIALTEHLFWCSLLRSMCTSINIEKASTK